MPKKSDLSTLIGQTFNRLTFIEELEPHITSGGYKHRKGLFRCLCGINKEIQISSVINNIVKSCGCHSRDNAKHRMIQINTKHGASKIPEYNIWVSMKKRCLKKSHKSFNDYGGRGINVDHSWINSFETFIQDMGLRPTKNHSLERIDNEKGYCKENCIWADKKTQQRNKRNNVKISAFGESKTMAEWAEILGFSWQKLHYRLFLSEKKYSLESILENESNYKNKATWNK